MKLATDEQQGHGAFEQNDASFDPNTPSPKRDRKRLWITLGIVAGVIIIAVAGFWIWHEQPSFCNAICHSPMDYYVNSYDEKDPSMGITAHANAGERCLNCHEAELTTQVSEVMAWVSDSYPMDKNGVTLATGKEFASEEFCARSGCHTDANNMEQVVAKTWGFEGNDEKYNPHASHQQFALECNDCHGIHEPNILICNQCHNLTMPEGWVTPNEAMEAQSKAESAAATSSNPTATEQSPGYTSTATGEVESPSADQADGDQTNADQANNDQANAEQTNETPADGGQNAQAA